MGRNNQEKWCAIKLFDEYSFKARKIPCLIVAIPYALFMAFSLNLFLPGGVACVFKCVISLFVSIGVSWGLVVYCLAEFLRDKGRKLQNQYFKTGLDLPTTRMLLWADTSLSQERKHLIHQLLNKKYHMQTLSPDGELQDEMLARRLISEAVDVVRPMVKDGVRLLQYNIRFGRMRNLTAGAGYGIIGAILGSVMGFCCHLPILGLVECCLGIFFLVIKLKTKSNIEWHGEEYAKVFWAEFLSREAAK